MAPSILHMPNGQTLTVSPVFGGYFFKANEQHHQGAAFPPGWTIILQSEDDEEERDEDATPTASMAAHGIDPREDRIHRFRKPTLKNDHMYISSISNPSSTDYKPAVSPTRQIAMMLWTSLWWYFHQPAPSPHVTTAASAQTPENGRPKADWRVNINKEGIFNGKHLLPKLERMGLIASEDSSVGLDPNDGVTKCGDSWCKMFVSQRNFWQLDARIYLFAPTPAQASTPFPSVSPASSRPASPDRRSGHLSTPSASRDDLYQARLGASTPPGPFTSTSHLPTFYPPPPAQYTFTNGMRHPIRRKPPRQGETFYTRYIPSLGQYLSFRVASLSDRPVAYRGPSSVAPALDATRSNSPSLSTFPAQTNTLTDVELLHKWMNDPRVAHSWGERGPQSHQRDFLAANLTSQHSFPIIGSFDGQPFGYFEVYWVKEDKLARHLDYTADWDRGLHCLVGEQEFRGPHRIRVWLSALVHACWLADARTETVVMEPRVDNEKLRRYCEEVGFFKEKEICFPHKQSNLMKIRREAWEAPAL